MKHRFLSFFWNTYYKFRDRKKPMRAVYIPKDFESPFVPFSKNHTFNQMGKTVDRLPTKDNEPNLSGSEGGE